jgi:hypothetical protein
VKKRLLLLAIGAFLVMSVDGRADQGSTYHLSFRTLHFMAGERVSKFDLHFRSAMIIGFRSIPVGWQINIDNDPSWVTQVSGMAVVGAADLEASALRPWFVSLLSEPSGGSVRGEEITVEGTITLSIGDRTRVIPIGGSDVLLVPTERR